MRDIDRAKELLAEAAVLLDERYADINEFGGPNTAMQLATEIAEFLAQWRDE